MANLITLSRLALLLVIVAIAYQPPGAWQLVTVPLLILLFITDALDGYVARKWNEASLFGAMFDIAGDRVVELTMWIILADLDLVFSMMASPLGHWLVAGKFMRIFYAVLKAVVFCWLMLIHPMPAVFEDFWATWGEAMSQAGRVLVYLAVATCIIRGLPVIAEFVYSERHAILGTLAANRDSRD
jgi:CDP-diacylglycerol--glycerol-3-phosphate 3-phosphatidyltransferase